MRRAGAALLTVAAMLAGCSQGAQHPGSPPDAGSRAASDQAAVEAASRAAGDPCKAPASLPAYAAAPEPLRRVDPVLTDKAVATLKNGCAGMRFHIAADGSVQDATLIAEQPEGFGFGAGSLAALRKSRFDPKLASPDWYYADTVILQRVVGAGGHIALDRTLAMWGSHP